MSDGKRDRRTMLKQAGLGIGAAASGTLFAGAYFAGLDGLLTAGRSISATHVGMAAGKSMGNCVATGHAAGLAAALSTKRGIMPREVKVAELQNALRKDGVDRTMGGKVQENVSSDRRA